MESGSPIPTSDMSGGQATYDTLVEKLGCAGSTDTLQCLREVPYAEFLAAMDQTPNIFSWEVRHATISKFRFSLMSVARSH